MNKMQILAKSMEGEADFLIKEYQLMQFLIEGLEQFSVYNERCVSGEKLTVFFEACKLQERFPFLDDLQIKTIINILLKFKML